MSFVDIEQLSFDYVRNGQPMIHDFSLTMNRGEVVGLIGPSGSGKSTFLRLVAGLETPYTGSIAIADKKVVDKQTFIPPERRGVGMIFQDYALFPHLTVAKNICFGLHHLSKKERKQRLKEMLELVHMEAYEKRYPHELSGGQQQRVALARALAPQPDLLLMDEPFSNLDADLKISIRTELREILRKTNITCLLVTHDQEDIEAICDHSVKIC